MKRAEPDSLTAGFSLIEAMATLALTAVIIMALSSVAGQWLPNWRRGFVDLQRADLLGVGLERMVDDLSAAEYVTPSASVPGPLFEGDATSVTFVRSAIGPDAYPHLEIVRLAQIKEARGLAMVRTRARFAPTAPRPPGARAPAIAFGDPVTLIRAPFHISFSYAGPDRLWLPTWKGRRDLPEAVRISVRDTVANRVSAASTVALIRVTGHGAPKIQAQANADGALPAPGQPPQGGAPPAPGQPVSQ
jgi:general secretion pathway protein J